jgi:two-component system, chemotaxis family, chemotaxis protein CheY
LKILIAEDESMTREMMLAMCSEIGECHGVTNGLEVIESFSICQNIDAYDLILIDISMPEMGGIETLSNIRRIEKDNNVPESDRVKIIMTTASKDRCSVHNAFEYECDAYMAKPISINKIRECLLRIG